MKVLVTGFEPFGTFKKNPSWEAIKKIKDLNGISIVKYELPVEYEKSTKMLLEILEKEKPNIAILTGVAGNRKDITVEKVAVNLRDANAPDNSGATLHDMPIFENGENAYFSTLPVRDIIDELNSNGINSSISYTAGTYVCNNAFYTLMYYINNSNKKIIGGFIHLPEDYSDNMSKALDIAIKKVIEQFE